MRIFVLTAGRTASTTFSNACGSIKGMSSGHETNAGVVEGRLEYPENHIEVDNRLIWFLPMLEEKYNEDVIYVYLKRSPSEVAKSYKKRWYVNCSVVRAFFNNILMAERIPTDVEKDKACELYAHLADKTIEHFLSGKDNKYVVNVESLEDDFLGFIESVGFDFDKDAAISIIRQKSNLNLPLAKRLSLKKFFLKVFRVIKGFPEYLRYS